MGPRPGGARVAEPEQRTDGRVELLGEVRDVVYENETSGYAVIRLGVPGLPHVTVTGPLFGVAKDARLRVVGTFKEHPKYGRQLAVDHFEEVLSRTKAGMIAYLSTQFSGSGIGERLAERIVAEFGERTYEVLDADPEAIAKVKGVGKKKGNALAAEWHQKKAVREATTFLQGHGVGPAQVQRVLAQYGDAAVSLVKANPYRLADDVRGIGFRSADKIARSLGIPKESPDRARAAVLYLLGDAGGQGHLLLPVDEAVRRAGELEVAEEAARAAVDALAADRSAIREDAPPARPVPAAGSPAEKTSDRGASRWDRKGPVLYLPRAHADELEVAALLARRCGPYKRALVAHVEQAAREIGLELAAAQVQALMTALESRAAVITGGPGVGKTTITWLLVERLRARGDEVVLAAPTGRAAKRLSEATQSEASTIHRLLKFDPLKGAFIHGDRFPLPLDHLVVDECSMLDVPLAAALLRALPRRARLTLVGDADQLPSVGPGDFFRSAVESGALPVVRLTQVYRQRDGSRIVAGAHAVNRGEMPEFDPPGKGGEFFFVQRDEPDAVADTIRTLVVDRIPQAYGFDPKTEVQVLSPMHKGSAGAENLNLVLGKALNPNPTAFVEHKGRRLHVGDRVVQTKNDYENLVFNGDQGFVTAVDAGRQVLAVRFDEQEVEFRYDDLQNLLPAWCTTVHRAQGGEHKAVVLALTNQHFPLLQRNLVYTAITRARRLCVVVGSRFALERAIANAATRERYSWLEERLAAASAAVARPPSDEDETP